MTFCTTFYRHQCWCVFHDQDDDFSMGGEAGEHRACAVLVARHAGQRVEEEAATEEARVSVPPTCPSPQSSPTSSPPSSKASLPAQQENDSHHRAAFIAMFAAIVDVRERAEMSCREDVVMFVVALACEWLAIQPPRGERVWATAWVQVPGRAHRPRAQVAVLESEVGEHEAAPVLAARQRGFTETN